MTLRHSQRVQHSRHANFPGAAGTKLRFCRACFRTLLFLFFTRNSGCGRHRQADSIRNSLCFFKRDGKQRPARIQAPCSCPIRTPTHALANVLVCTIHGNLLTAIRPHISAAALFLVGDPLTVVVITIEIHVSTTAMSHISLEFTNVDITRGADDLTLPFLLPVLEGAFMRVTSSVNILASARHGCD